MNPITIDLNDIGGRGLPELSPSMRLQMHIHWLRREISTIGARARSGEITHDLAADLIEALPEKPTERG